MGRKKKYHTEEEIRLANNIKAEKYYLKNRDMIKDKNKKRYYDNLQNNKFNK